MSEKRFFIKESTLTGIGDALREVTGGTAKIPVAQIEDTIRSLSSGGDSSKEATVSKFSFEATSQQQTVEHNSGKIPDMIIIVPTTVPTLQKEMVLCVGFSSAMMNKFPYGTGVGVMMSILTSGGLLTVQQSLGYENAIPSVNGEHSGLLRSVTANEFTIGTVEEGTNVQLAPGKNYVVDMYFDLA